MSTLQEVRKLFGNLQSGTDKTDKSPSVSSVSAASLISEKFSVQAGDTYQALIPDLERRYRLMAARWKYTQADLAEALEAARRDPAGALLAVIADEARTDAERDRWLQ